MSFENKVLYIQSSIDENFRMILDTKWKSTEPEHRKNIRKCLEEKFTVRFSRQQLAWLNDLNKRPEADDGFFSITHCKSLGGFTYSKLPHGFDVEETRRISLEIIKRTAPETEQQAALRPEHLWVAKEAGYKALSVQREDLLVTDLLCSDWQSHYENQVFSFRLISEKTLDFSLNKGFIFSEDDKLFCVFFK